MHEYGSLSHTTWDCKYHVVFIPKCRRRTLYQGTHPTCAPGHGRRLEGNAVGYAAMTAEAWAAASARAFQAQGVNSSMRWAE